MENYFYRYVYSTESEFRNVIISFLDDLKLVLSYVYVFLNSGYTRAQKIIFVGENPQIPYNIFEYKFLIFCLLF